MFLAENLGYRDLQRKFFGRYAPDLWKFPIGLYLCPNWVEYTLKVNFRISISPASWWGAYMWKKIPGTGIFVQKKRNSRYLGFSNKKKFLGTRIYRENFSGATRPIKTLSCILIGGALMASLGGREFDVARRRWQNFGVMLEILEPIEVGEGSFSLQNINHIFTQWA